MFLTEASRFRSAFQEHANIFKNSGALAIGTGTASVLGSVYWWLAARSFWLIVAFAAIRWVHDSAESTL